jgi:oxidase EvaA
MKKPDWLEAWFSLIVEHSDFRVDAIPLASSSEWAFSDGSIRHRSGLFFSIVGARWKSPNGQLIEQPLIDQREIGTLGFLLRRIGRDQEVLAHAKIEPGNVGIVQLAPTCQATASNIARVHSGHMPPYSECFMPGKAHIVYDSLQSEQGTRFLHKRNRNVLATVATPVPLIETHRWLPVDEILELLKLDYVVNTDARSVLTCSPWRLLVARAPFTRYSTPFAAALAHSATYASTDKSIHAVRKELMSLRAMINAPEIVPLDKLNRWKLTDEGISSSDGKPFIVRQIKVLAHGREVSLWDQPIIESASEGRIDLVCGRRNGTLCFLFRPQIEMGLYNSVELGPTVIVEPGQELLEDDPLDRPGAVLVIECRHSDEGGRFYHDSSVYRIIDVGDVYAVPDSYQWLSLQQIRILLDEQGWFTNEVRGVLSLLLTWL